MQARVTAVLVAHNGAEFLPETLAALAAQTRPADFCIGVDAGSTDDSASLLQLRLPVGSPVISAPVRSGFGASVGAATAEIPRQAAPTDQSLPDLHNGQAAAPEEWLWLLHDDSAPEPDALQNLLHAVEMAPSVTVAGCKQITWDNPRRLVDAGLFLSRRAERATLIDTDELDQGQYDARDDVFAVNSAGMLIRRDVWDRLGGFDAALPGTGDDIDFCWRNRLAGNRVVVVPRAVVRHAGHRSNGMATPMAARRAQVHLRLKHAPLWQVPLLAAAAVLGGMYRLLVGILAKEPGYGFGQLAASIAAVSRPFVLFRSRRQAEKTRRLPRGKVAALRATNREIRAHRRSLLESAAAQVVGDGTGSESQTAYVPSGDAADDFAALAAPAKTWAGLGAVIAALLLTAVSLTGLRRFVGAEALTGGGLLPLSASPAEIWHNATSWWQGVGAGTPGHGDPFDLVLWLLSLIGFGDGTTAVLWLVLLSMPMAGVAAWFLAAALTPRRGLRFWAALFWGTVPALQVALGSGRLGALVVHLLLPLLVLAVLRAVGAGKAPGSPNALASSGPSELLLKPGINGVPSWTAAAVAGLILAAVAAAAPLTYAVAAVAILAVLLLMRRRAKTLWWALLPGLAVFAPFLLSAADRIRAFAADPGVPLPFDAAEPWQQLLGFPVAFGAEHGLAAFPGLPDGPWALVAALLIGAPVVILAAVALFLPDSAAVNGLSGTRLNGLAVPGAGRRDLARLAWTVALAAMLANMGSAWMATGVGSDALVTPFTGPLVSVIAVMMLTAALTGADRLSEVQPAVRGRGPWLTAAAATATVVFAAGPVLSLALWLVPQFDAAAEVREGATRFGTDVKIIPGAARTLPATAADRGNSSERVRTLVLGVEGEGRITAALMRGGGTTLDQLSAVDAARTIDGPLNAAGVRADDDAAKGLRATVAIITAGTGADPRQELSRFGVGFVVLKESNTSAELLAARLDAVPGLNPVGRTGGGWLWRVAGPVRADGTEAANGQAGRLRILSAQGAATVLDSGITDADVKIPAGGVGRSLMLAERFDPNWKAWLNGLPLAAAHNGWAQAFELPEEAGTLELRYVSPWEPWVRVLQIGILGLTLLMAVPMPARRRLVMLHPAITQREGITQREAGRHALDKTSRPEADADADTDAAGSEPRTKDDLHLVGAGRADS